MKIEWNKKYTTVAIYALIVIALAVLFVVFVFRFESFSEGFSWVGSVVAPVICGLVIAYILNPLMMYFENKFFKKLKNPPIVADTAAVNKGKADSSPLNKIKKLPENPIKKARRRKTIARVLSLLITFVVVFVIIGALILAVGPNIAKSIVDLADRFPYYIKEIEHYLEDFFEDNPDISAFIFDEFTDLSEELKKLAETLQPMAGDIIGNVSSGLWSFVVSILVGLKNVLLGVIIAIYLLFSKERLLAQCKQIIFAFIKEKHWKGFFSFCSKSNNIFKKYIVSNLVDAMVVFVFMLVGMFIMKMPYATLVSAICAVTNLIPFFGPFIGAVPCAVLILLDDPSKVIWFALFVLVLQQCDGNIIKPFLFGETMGLPAIWVLVSIILGGGLFGIPGMLLGAPVFAVIYTMSADFVKARLKKQNLPESTETYVQSIEDFSNEYLAGRAESSKSDTK
ncbi:MAG: AI-2E family transporter [Oscillospiraceae bacterium]|nr:AI-2E family transporter [Oscillospiraceae bacterium]